MRAALALPLGVAASTGLGATADPMVDLARDRGCFVCHEVGTGPPPVAQLLPTAPSFRDIARRYRGKPDAQARLVGIVVHGTPGESGRHWKYEAGAGPMGPNDLMVSQGEAERLVAWILALDRPAPRAGATGKAPPAAR
jgi:cytochrome c